MRSPVLMNSLKKLALGVVCTCLISCATSPTGRSQFILISPDAAIIESEAAYLDTRSTARQGRQTGQRPAHSRASRPHYGSVGVHSRRRLFRKWPTGNGVWPLSTIRKTVNAWCMAGGRMAVVYGAFLTSWH